MLCPTLMNTHAYAPNPDACHSLVHFAWVSAHIGRGMSSEQPAHSIHSNKSKRKAPGAGFPSGRRSVVGTMSRGARFIRQELSSKVALEASTNQ